MDVVRLCDGFGWKYCEGEFIDQPNWFIELLLRKRRWDSDYQDSKSQAKTGK